MLSQVAGRAGRKDVRGKVLIQTYQPHHAIIQQVINGDYEKMLDQQLKDRKEYRYPPFTRLIRIVVNHRDIETVKKASQWIVNILLQSEYGQIFGPIFPSIARVRNRYRMQIMVKITSDKSRERVKQIIQKTLEGFVSISQFRACRVNLDVDPY